jgi:tetratricopeptide (TPR) repeat protein
MVLDRIESPRTRASMLALIGQWSSAERILQTISAGDALARFWLAFVYGQQHQSDEALKTLRSVPSIEVYFAEAGFEAERQGNYERAMQLWEASTLFDGGDLRQRAHVNQTLSRTAYNHFGDWEAALRWAERWIDAASGDTDSYIWLASLHLWGGSPEAAYQVLERGALHGVQNSRFYPGQMGQIYQARGQWDLAIQFYRQSWEQNQDDPGMSPYIAWYLGFALAHELHFQEARPYLEIVKRTGKPELRQQATDLLTWINTQEPQ